MTFITIKQNDTARQITDELTLDGDPLDLTNATASLVWKNRDTGVVSRKTATVVTATSGSVSYSLQAADTATAGNYQLEWDCILSDGGVITIPTHPDDKVYLYIEPDLG